LLKGESEMNFDIKNYPGKYAMHCKTEKEAKEFLTYLHRAGRRWSTGDSYLLKTHWDAYEEETAYAFNVGMFCGVEWYENHGFKVLEWADFNGTKAKPKAKSATITDAERQYLLKEMKNLFDEYDYVYTEHALNKIIDEWAYNKETLIEAFKKHPNYVDGKFMIAFEKAYTRKMKVQSVREFGKYICNIVACDCLKFLPEPIDIRRINDWANYLPSNLWSFFEDFADYMERTISSDMYERLDYIIPEVPVHVGEKTTRVINKICKYLGYDKHEDYNKRFAEFSDAMSPTTIKRTCVLSINPLDYLTMSFGNSWSSCHTIDKHNKRGMPNSYEGRYSSGTMSYMLDTPSMVFYTVNKKKDIDSHIKIERQMFHYCDNTLVQGRLYPQDNDYGAKEIYDEYRSAVQGILSEMFKLSLWDYYEGTDVIRDYVGSEGTHYRDYRNFDNCTISWSERSEPAPMIIGHDPICIDCGFSHHHEENVSCCGRRWVTCADCGQRVRADEALYCDGDYYCSNCVTTCPQCGDRIPRSMELTEIDGRMYCGHCLSNHFAMCDDCGELVRVDGMHTVNFCHRVCQSCFEQNYTRCPDCGVIYRNGSTHMCLRTINLNEAYSGTATETSNIRYDIDLSWLTSAEVTTNGEI